MRFTPLLLKERLWTIPLRFVVTKTPKFEEKTTSKLAKITGYALYLKAASVKLRNAKLPVSEISKRVAKEWAEASPETRQKFIDEALKLNAKIQPKPTTTPPPSTKSARPQNAYSAFVKATYPAIQAQFPDKTFGEKSRMVAEMWRNLSAEEKARRKAALKD